MHYIIDLTILTLSFISVVYIEEGVHYNEATTVRQLALTYKYPGIGHKVMEARKINLRCFLVTLIGIVIQLTKVCDVLGAFYHELWPRQLLLSIFAVVLNAVLYMGHFYTLRVSGYSIVKHHLSDWQLMLGVGG